MSLRLGVAIEFLTALSFTSQGRRDASDIRGRLPTSCHDCYLWTPITDHGLRLRLRAQVKMSSAL